MSKDAKKKYLQFLTKKGIVCKKNNSCCGCKAFSPCTKDEVFGDNDTQTEKMSWEEIQQKFYVGECVMGFSQKWIYWGIAVPIEDCPKPITQKELFRCINKID